MYIHLTPSLPSSLNRFFQSGSSFTLNLVPIDWDLKWKVKEEEGFCHIFVD